MFIMAKPKNKSYTMQEMADILKVNKTTVYRYLKKNNITPATIKSNANHYDATVLQQLKKHFKASDTTNVTKSANDRLIETLQQQVQSLQEELKGEKIRADKQAEAKDRQIDALNDRLQEAHQLQLGLEKQLKMLPSKNVVEGEATDSEIKEDNTEKNATHKSWWHFW